MLLAGNSIRSCWTNNVNYGHVQGASTREGIHTSVTKSFAASTLRMRPRESGRMLVENDAFSFMLEWREGFLQLPRVVVGGFWSMKGGVVLWGWPSDGQCFMLAALHTCLLLTSMLDARLPSTRTPRGCRSGYEFASWFIYVRDRTQTHARYKMIFLLGSFPSSGTILMGSDPLQLPVVSGLLVSMPLEEAGPLEKLCTFLRRSLAGPSLKRHLPSPLFLLTTSNDLLVDFVIALGHRLSSRVPGGTNVVWMPPHHG